MDFMRVVCGVIKFLYRLCVRKVIFGVAAELAGIVEPSQVPHGCSLFWGIHILVIGFERLVISNVFKLFVPNHADDIVTLIHTISGSINVGSFGWLTCSKKCPALHIGRAFDPPEIQDRRAQVDGTHQAIGYASGFVVSEMFELFGYVNNERDVSARIIEPSFCTWQPNAVIRPEKDNGVLVKSR